MPMRNCNTFAKQRDVGRRSNLNCASRIASIAMCDFKRCTANSPFCLGMTDSSCCDSDDCHWANHLRKPPCHHQSDLRKLSARKKYRRPPKVASLQILQEALDGQFIPFKNWLISETNIARRNTLGISLTNHTLQM